MACVTSHGSGEMIQPAEDAGPEYTLYNGVYKDVVVPGILCLTGSVKLKTGHCYFPFWVLFPPFLISWSLLGVVPCLPALFGLR